MPRMCMVVFFSRENAYVAILAADSKRYFWAAWTVMNNCRSQFGWQCAQLKESCRASGLTPELPVHVVLVSSVAGSAVADCVVVGSAAASLSGAGSAAASSSGAGTDGATSTASRLLFSGLPSEVSSSPAVVVTQKLRIILVPATALSNRCFFALFFSGTGVTGQE